MAPHLRKKAFRWNAFLRHVMALCRSAQFSLPVDAMIARETLSRLMQWLGFLELVTRLASYKNISISFGEAQASLAGLPIPQLVQSISIIGRKLQMSCRPSNSPVGTIETHIVLTVSVSCRPSNSPVGTIQVPTITCQFGSCRPSNSPVGTIHTAVSRKSPPSCRPSNSPVGTIIATVPDPLIRSCRPSNSPVGTIARKSAIHSRRSCRPSNSPVGTINR